MIKLEVKEYCQTCEYFTADVEAPQPLINMFGEDIPGTMGDTIIRCQYRRRCKKMINYLTGQIHSYEVKDE